MRNHKTALLLLAFSLVTLPSLNSSQALAAAEAQSESGSWQEMTDRALKVYEAGDLKSAESLLTRALAEAEKMGKENPKLFKSLDNLALIYFKEGSLVKAEPLLERSLVLQEAKYGPDNLKIAEALHNLGILYLSEDKLDDAEKSFKRLLDIRESKLDK